jgi:hypothetical protein
MSEKKSNELTEEELDEVAGGTRLPVAPRRPLATSFSVKLNGAFVDGGETFNFSNDVLTVTDDETEDKLPEGE